MRSMKLRAILASHLRANMQRSASLDTQARLAKAAGVTQSTVNRALTTEVGVSVDIVEALAHALHVPPILLLADAGQAAFLNAWYALDAEDQARVLSFMQIANHNKSATMASLQLNLAIEPNGHRLAAAVGRASSQPIKGERDAELRRTSDTTARAATRKRVAN